MSIQFFPPLGDIKTPVNLPKGYRRTVKWLPQIGDIFPDFSLPSTEGDIDFWSWAEGHWVMLFGHPAAWTPVCTTEIAALSANRPEFEALDTKVLGLTGSSLGDLHAWHEDIEHTFGTEVWFPTMEDADGCFASLFGMIHANEHKQCPVRKSFLLDPQMRIRMIFEYPTTVGRSVEETLRVIEACQTYTQTGFATPADCFDGRPVIVPEGTTDRQFTAHGGTAPQRILPYLRIAP